MFEEIRSATAGLVGIGEDDLDLVQMVVRAFVIYVTAIVLVKLGEKRFMGRSTAFDMILGIILGSVLSRAITGNAPFLDTIGAGTALVALHWAFSVASFHHDWFGKLVKGRERNLVIDGEIDWEGMRKSHISRRDLESAMYSSGRVTELADVKVARFERSGEISIIPKTRPRETRIVEVSVQDGVQNIRIEIS
jgi:uncharacterized membrane protein YcaP (DUF421 family)